MKRFPKISADGSFAVRAVFPGHPRDGISAVQHWLSHWIAHNSEWEFFGETRRYSYCFRAEPEASLSSSGALCVSFRGIADDRRMWRDWMVRILKELHDHFPEVGPPAETRIEDDA